MYQREKKLHSLAGVRNHGVEEDPETHSKYISFYDPDGIAWELYSVLTRSEV